MHAVVFLTCQRQHPVPRPPSPPLPSYLHSFDTAVCVCCYLRHSASAADRGRSQRGARSDEKMRTFEFKPRSHEAVLLTASAINHSTWVVTCGSSCVCGGTTCVWQHPLVLTRTHSFFLSWFCSVMLLWNYPLFLLLKKKTFLLAVKSRDRVQEATSVVQAQCQ